MKTLTTRWTIAVFALAAAAVSASAQTYKADIPMAFRAGDKLMDPGSYDFVVTVNYSGHATVLVRSHDGRDAALLVPVPGPGAPKAWREEAYPKISFACLGHECSLHQLWNARDVSAYEFTARKLPPADAERLASVTLTMTRTE